MASYVLDVDCPYIFYGTHFAHDNLVQDHAFLTKELSNEKSKTSESSSHGSIDQSYIVANPCDVGKK